MFENDRDFIANKYHKQNEPFNAYNRMAYHGYDFDERTGKSDGEILDGLKNSTSMVLRTTKSRQKRSLTSSTTRVST